MSDTSRKQNDPLAMLNLWMKTSQSFWKVFSTGSAGKEKGKKEKKDEARENIRSRVPSWEAALKAWQAMAAAMAKTETMEAFNESSDALPDAVMKIMESGWNSFFTLQQMWMEKGAKIGKTADAYQFENLDEDAFRLWNELYETEFKKFLNIPQLGLTRYYQEHLQKATDKFAVYQSTMTEFINTILLPMERSLTVVQEELTAMAEEDKLPEDPKEYYRLWIKVLEGHFMVLFKSEEYTKVLNKAINASTDFTRARKEVLTDLLQFLPLPTQQDMDDLYQEIYVLKKRLKALEKTVVSDQ